MSTDQLMSQYHVILTDHFLNLSYNNTLSAVGLLFFVSVSLGDASYTVEKNAGELNLSMENEFSDCLHPDVAAV